MNNLIESLLESDHRSLSVLLREIDLELLKADIAHAYELIDFVWARLAVHIRAENLQLFPTIRRVPAVLFAGQEGIPTFEEAQNVLTVLRTDHDFFMKEFARVIETMRELKRSSPSEQIQVVRNRLAAIEERLNTHNRLEEEQVYVWPSLVLDEQSINELWRAVGRELDNLPPRFQQFSREAAR